jgi:hypothetical protein
MVVKYQFAGKFETHALRRSGRSNRTALAGKTLPACLDRQSESCSRPTPYALGQLQLQARSQLLSRSITAETTGLRSVAHFNHARSPTVLAKGINDLLKFRMMFAP